MTDDQQTVRAAYDETVKKLFFSLFDAYAQAGGDAGQEQEADQHFVTGIGSARRARDRALSLAARSAGSGH
jgi:hypothetical protein